MKIVLITAYAVNPYKGSEDATGWNLILQAARTHRVVAVTRENNRPPIERYLAARPQLAWVNERVEFLYFDLPAWTRWWKKGPLLSVLYFYMWQVGLAIWLRRSCPPVDLVHNLNFHSDWTPSFLWLLRRPLVWGPIGHHALIPSSHLRHHGASAYCKDRMLGLVKHSFWLLDPFLRVTRHQARRVLCVNSTVATQLRLHPDKFEIVPAVAVELPNLYPHPDKGGMFTVMIAGRMVPLKGFDMVVQAFGKFYHRLSSSQQQKVRLLLVGSGPEELRLLQQVTAQGLDLCTEHRPWLERSELLTTYQQASVFFFPSHEGAGMVVLEAQSYGVPVLCYSNDGPGELVPPASSLKVPYASREQNINDFAAQLQRLFADPGLQEAESALSLSHVAAHHTWDRRGLQLQHIYQHVLAQ